EGDAVEGRLLDGAEALVLQGRAVLCHQLPLALAAVEIGVRSGLREPVEALDGSAKAGGVDAELSGELLDRVGAGDRLRYRAAGGLMREREIVGILLVEDQ